MSRHLLEQAKELLESMFRETPIDIEVVEKLVADLQHELDIGRKYKQGNYLIARFDDYGAKLATVLSEKPGLTGAQEQAKAEIADGVCASATVLLVCWNSKDVQTERWQVKP